MNISRTTLDSVFTECASRLGSKVAIRERNQAWSYSELLIRSETFSEFLSSVGVAKGHRVALMLPNSGAFVMTFFGISRIGAIVMPLNPHYQSQELEYFLSDTPISALVIYQETITQAKKVLDRMKHPPSLIEVSSRGDFKTINEGVKKAGGIIDKGDLPILNQYTSGSTGDPKRVVRTHRKIINELEQLVKVFDLDENDKFLGVAPFSHVNGLVRTMLTSMFTGGTLYPMTNFNRREILRIISEERITYFGAVPYVYILLTATPLRNAVELSSLRTVFSASAPLMPEDNRAFADKYGVFIRQLYGSTETGTISVNNDLDIQDSPESVGLPLEGISVEIFNEKGKALPIGQQGEIGISSPYAITAYENNPEANAQCFRKGYYLSGDIGFKDGRGCLTLTGRKKFLINRGGYEVNPFEVEKAIQTYPKIREVVVYGVTTRHGDQSIQCKIVANEACTREEIIVHCSSRIAEHKIPSFIEFVEALPKSQTGKFLRNNLT